MIMPGQWIGLNRIRRNFKEFEFKGKNIQKDYLDFIGRQCVQLLKDNTPRDSGELADSWKIVAKGVDFIEVGTDLQALVRDLSEGTAPHIIVPKTKDVLRFEVGGQEVFAAQVFHPGIRRNPFIDNVNRIMSELIIKTLEQALKENHVYFADLRGVGGKGRKFQQVGRTSAGFRGGTSSRGRSTLIRAGTGRRQLKRRLTLRRRTAAGKKPRELKTKLG